MAHIVTAPLVIVKKEDGSDQYLYEGAVVPDFVEKDRLDYLVAAGLVDKVSAEQAKKAGAPISESN